MGALVYRELASRHLDFHRGHLSDRISHHHRAPRAQAPRLDRRGARRTVVRGRAVLHRARRQVPALSPGFFQPETADILAGLVLLGLVIELCRRSTGWGLTTLVAVLLTFTVFGSWMPGALRHDNFGIVYFIEMMTITENGIYGAPLEVAATYAFLFVLFGSFYEKSGGGQLFFELAGAVTGRMRGGAAKACVTASGLYGSISGSPTADVATTGPLTIPIMKKMGIPAARAGAIEATASSGGAMLPPVMGAVAFIMSD